MVQPDVSKKLYSYGFAVIKTIQEIFHSIYTSNHKHKLTNVQRLNADNMVALTQPNEDFTADNYNRRSTVAEIAACVLLNATFFDCKHMDVNV
jgi:hypothetical protein